MAAFHYAGVVMGYITVQPSLAFTQKLQEAFFYEMLVMNRVNIVMMDFV